MEAQLEHEQGMLQQELAEVGHEAFTFEDAYHKGFEVGAGRMRRRAGGTTLSIALLDGAPLEQGEELAIALHQGVVLEQASQGGLVKHEGVWYHGGKLLVLRVGW